MAELSCLVKVDIVIGGRLCPPSLQGLQAGLASAGVGAGHGRITGFFLGSWIGAGSDAFSLSRLSDDASAPVRLTIRDGVDVDTVKFAVSFNVLGPKGTRNCALSSSWVGLGELVELLRRAGPKGGFGGGDGCLRMRDNFYPGNVALLRFRNVTTDLGVASALRLQPSVLHSLDRINTAVKRVGDGVKAALQNFAVSAVNAGPQYMDSFTYWHMQDCLCCYPILGHLFASIKHPESLAWLVYDAAITAHSTGLPPAQVLAMPLHDAVIRYGVPMVASQTGCALTTVYSTDYTAGLTGQVVQLRETEDIARTFGRMPILTQGEKPLRRFVSDLREGLPGLGRCIAILSAALEARRGPGGLSDRITATLSADDCENQAWALVLKALGLRGMYASLLSEAGPGQSSEDDLAARLCARISHEARTEPLLACLAPEDHAPLARVLVRLGGALYRGDWVNSFTVCSAKGPSYRPDCPEGCADLCGHGTVLASVLRADGVRTFVPVEGTTYFRACLPPPEGYTRELRLRLDDGRVMPFPVTGALTVLSQNMAAVAGLGPDIAVLSCLDSDYNADPAKSPFYAAAFYTSFGKDARTMGCIPLDGDPPTYCGAGERPLFGAPLMGLSRATTMAYPVGLSLLADTEAEQDELHALMRAQLEEIYAPGIDPATLANITTQWQPCPPLREIRTPTGPFGVAECCSAFDNPDHTAMAVAVYRALADRFNELQAKDPHTDGAVANARGHYLSAALSVRLPIPKAGGTEPHRLSTISNLRLAANQIGIGGLTACPMKTRAMAARARVPAEHHVYMADGPVHANRVRLA
jgi:hypothetical protein